VTLFNSDWDHHAKPTRTDSITTGERSTDGNGYRGDLMSKLIPNNTVTMIGSQRAGNMSNNANEGHSGLTIAQVQGYLTNPQALPSRPNIVLLHIGTNDMYQNLYVTTAPHRLSSMMDQIFAGCPDVVLLVALIVQSSAAATNSLIVEYNNAIKTSVIPTFASAGKHVVMVDMYNGLNSTTDFADFLHPNDLGYARMAEIWYEGLQKAHAAKWIGVPAGVGKTSASMKTTSEGLNGAYATRNTTFWGLFGRFSLGLWL